MTYFKFFRLGHVHCNVPQTGERITLALLALVYYDGHAAIDTAYEDGEGWISNMQSIMFFKNSNKLYDEVIAKKMKTFMDKYSTQYNNISITFDGDDYKEFSDSFTNAYAL